MIICDVCYKKFPDGYTMHDCIGVVPNELTQTLSQSIYYDSGAWMYIIGNRYIVPIAPEHPLHNRVRSDGPAS